LGKSTRYLEVGPVKGKEDIVNDSGKVEFVDFNGKGNYSDPEFVWDKAAVPPELVFLDSDKLGQQYKNDILVGSVKKERYIILTLVKIEKHVFGWSLSDLVLNKKDNASKIIFGENFGIITDLEVGTDGYLYVVSVVKATDKGAIYRVVPNSN
jgi:aldose sugar dehydrogenase